MVNNTKLFLFIFRFHVGEIHKTNWLWEVWQTVSVCLCRVFMNEIDNNRYVGFFRYLIWSKLWIIFWIWTWKTTQGCVEQRIISVTKRMSAKWIPLWLQYQAAWNIEMWILVNWAWRQQFWAFTISRDWWVSPQCSWVDTSKVSAAVELPRWHNYCFLLYEAVAPNSQRNNLQHPKNDQKLTGS